MVNRKRDKRWMRNRNQLKNPKFFQVTMLRNPDGSFHVLGGEAKVLARKNKVSSSWINVDARDLACEMRRNPIKSF